MCFQSKRKSIRQYYSNISEWRVLQRLRDEGVVNYVLYCTNY